MFCDWTAEIRKVNKTAVKSCWRRSEENMKNHFKIDQKFMIHEKLLKNTIYKVGEGWKLCNMSL